MDPIDKLLEKYFEGETSLQEEQRLRAYFNGRKIAEHHKIYTPIFGFFSEEIRREKKKSFPARKYLWVPLGTAAAIFIFLVLQVISFHKGNINDRSMVYIDGKKITDVHQMNVFILASIESVSDINDEIAGSQIQILDLFTDE